MSLFERSSRMRERVKDNHRRGRVGYPHLSERTEAAYEVLDDVDEEIAGHTERSVAALAGAHAHNMGSSIDTLAVISVASTSPVIGARTTPVKNAIMPTTANPSGLISR